MFKTMLAMVEVLRKGSSVADPAAWKNRAAAVMAVSGLIMAAVELAKRFGYELPIDGEMAAAIAGFVVVCVGLYSTYSTSSKIGIFPPERDPSDGMPAEAGTSDPAQRDMQGGSN